MVHYKPSANPPPTPGPRTITRFRFDICICYSIDGAYIFYRIPINFWLIVSKSELFDCD